MIPAARYWHIFGGVIPEGEFLAGCWHTIVAGPSDYAVPPSTELAHGTKWLQTLNHKPTDAEVAVHTPEEYQQ